VRVSCQSGRTRIGIFPGVLSISPELSSARDAGLARIDLARNARSAIGVNARVTEPLENQTRSAPAARDVEPEVRGLRPRRPAGAVRGARQGRDHDQGQGHPAVPGPELHDPITDTLSVRSGAVDCTTATRMRGDTRIHKALFAVSLLTAPANAGTLAAGFGAQLGLIQHGIAAQNATQGDRGPGCLLAEQVFLRDIALSGGRRLVFDYASAGVENGDLVARFFPRLVAPAS
jgi:hypothetical protein